MGVEHFGLSIPCVFALNHDLAEAFFTARPLAAWLLVALIAKHVLPTLRHLFADPWPARTDDTSGAPADGASVNRVSEPLVEHRIVARCSSSTTTCKW